MEKHTWKGGSMEFMVTDDMRVLPLSMSSTLQVVREAQVQTAELLEKEVILTKHQVLFFKKKIQVHWLDSLSI